MSERTQTPAVGSPRGRATARLLWAGCRPHPDLPALHSAVADGADVPFACGIAVYYGRTGPMFWRSLELAGLLDLTDDSYELLRLEHDIRRVQGAVLVPLAVATAIEPLTSGGLEPLLHKGPLVAERYPDPGLRPMDDIDVILPPDQHERGLALLTAAGWSVVERPGRHYDSVLVHPSVPDLALELHSALDSWRDRAHRLTSMDLWRARRPVECLGTKAFSIAPELELVALAAHAGKPFHTFRRLIWSVDFAVVVEHAGPAFDWDEVERVARATGCRTAVAVALRHARRLGADVPDELLAIKVGRYRHMALQPVLDEEWPLLFLDDGEVHRLRYALWDVRRYPRLFVGELTEYGPARVPALLLGSLSRGVRRWWRWRRTQPAVEHDAAVHDPA